MSVRIRMKKMGRAHRHFFRICAMDRKSPRNGRVLEELGTYDPMLAETDARAVLKRERIDYWLSVGAQPSDKVAILIKKYGTEGTHLEAHEKALERLAMGREIPDPGAPASLPKEPEPEKPAEEAAAPSDEQKGDEKKDGEAKPAEEQAADEKPAEEAKAEEPKAEEAAASEG